MHKGTSYDLICSINPLTTVHARKLVRYDTLFIVPVQDFLPYSKTGITLLVVMVCNEIIRCVESEELFAVWEGAKGV